MFTPLKIQFNLTEILTFFYYSAKYNTQSRLNNNNKISIKYQWKIFSFPENKKTLGKNIENTFFLFLHEKKNDTAMNDLTIARRIACL